MVAPHTLTPHTVRNWRLLEREIIDALCQQGVKFEKNVFGDHCVSGIVRAECPAQYRRRSSLDKSACRVTRQTN
jgi:hypothetical protein